MIPIARFATRHLDGQPGATDLFLGLMLKSACSALKPDWVYEIREVLGELMIVPIGPCADPTAWNHEIGDIVVNYKESVFCTSSEVARTLGRDHATPPRQTSRPQTPTSKHQT